MKLNGYLAKSTVVAALGGLLFGFDTVVISGTTSGLTAAYNLSPWLKGFTVSAALWGTVLGALLAAFPGDKYGRRNSLRGMAVLYLVSALGCAAAWSWTALVVFRLICGLAIGGSSVLGPMYIAEVSPAAWRGRLVGFFQFNIVFGILVAYLSNYLIGTLNLGAAEWRWDLGVAAIPAAFFFVMLFFIPRSPRWLAKKQHPAEALEVLKLIGEPNYELEMQAITASIDAEHGHADEPLFSPKYRVPIFLAASIAFFNQFCGINAILYYLNDIFAAAGFSKLSASLQAVFVGMTNLIFTVLAMAVIDKFGRKKLLLIGAVGTSACLAGVAGIFTSGKRPDLLIWLLIAYIAFFAFSQGAVIWVYISEVFPNRVRAKGQSLGSFTHWIMAALISLGFPAVARWSKPLPFVFFAAITVVQFFVVLFAYPETKGVSLEEIQKEMSVV
jgi:sugar porter (SP) family MFS transporter